MSRCTVHGRCPAFGSCKVKQRPSSRAPIWRDCPERSANVLFAFVVAGVATPSVEVVHTQAGGDGGTTDAVPVFPATARVEELQRIACAVDFVSSH